jgi:hypothetical protein
MSQELTWRWFDTVLASNKHLQIERITSGSVTRSDLSLGYSSGLDHSSIPLDDRLLVYHIGHRISQSLVHRI